MAPTVPSGYDIQMNPARGREPLAPVRGTLIRHSLTSPLTYGMIGMVEDHGD